MLIVSLFSFDLNITLDNGNKPQFQLLIRKKLSVIFCISYAIYQYGNLQTIIIMNFNEKKPI